MSSSTLPLELIYAIIDDLAGDKSALSACSLTSFSLREQAQKHLFSDIVFYLDITDPSRADNLHETLHSNPRLASFVVSLKVCISQPFGREFIARHVALLNRFPRIRSVVLTSATPRKILWKTMQLNLRMALLTLIQQLTVETLILEYQGSFPAQILSHCWRLKDLTVRNCWLRTDQSRMSTELGRSSPSRQQGYLESLTVDVASDLLLILPSSTLSFSRLHTVDVSALREDAPVHTLQNILDAASLSLQRLSLKFIRFPSNPADSANPIISLRTLKCLNFIALKSVRKYRPGLVGRFLSIITSLPTTLRGVITHITFQVDPKIAFPTEYPEEWRLLDTTLTAMHTAEILAPLRVFVFRYDRDSRAPELRRMLPGLDARGCLWV